MTELLLVFHIVAAFFALRSRSLLGAVIFLSVFSLFSSLLFYHLDAPDVAITEAAVGAGVSTLIFIWVVQIGRASCRERV